LKLLLKTSRTRRILRVSLLMPLTIKLVLKAMPMMNKLMPNPLKKKKVPNKLPRTQPN